MCGRTAARRTNNKPAKLFMPMDRIDSLMLPLNDDIRPTTFAALMSLGTQIQEFCA